MCDVGTANVEGPGDRMAVGQHQRVGPELLDLGLDLHNLLGLGDAGILQAVDRDRRDRRLRPVRPDGVDRIAVDRDQFGAGLGAGGGETLGCRKSVQPRIKP